MAAWRGEPAAVPAGGGPSEDRLGGGAAGRVPAMDLLLMVEGGGREREQRGGGGGGATTDHRGQGRLGIGAPDFSSGSRPVEMTTTNGVPSQYGFAHPAATDLWLMNNSYMCHGFSFSNASSSNSASYGSNFLDLTESHPSSNTIPFQIGSVTPNFVSSSYLASAGQCNSANVPIGSHCTFFPATSKGSFMNFFNDNKHLDGVEKNSHRVREPSENLLTLFPTSERNSSCQEYVRNINSNSFQARERSALETLHASGQGMIYHPIQEHDDDVNYMGLMIVLQKELSNSDVGSVGRIVLPKREAEINLPPLLERDGLMLYMDDIVLQATWKFKYRYWPNNKSRMYILENTGDFVNAHGLQSGDLLIIYRNAVSGDYIVRGKKGTGSPPTSALHSKSRHEHNLNETCNCRPPRMEKQKGVQKHRCRDQSQISGHTSTNSAIMTESDSFSMVSVNNLDEVAVSSKFSHVSPGIDLESISFAGMMD